MFTWDVQKALLNFEKHGVSFEEAASTFRDQYGLEIEDLKHSNVEKRLVRFGTSSRERLLTVVFTIRRLSNGQETIRIISARQASRRERENYARFRDRL